MQLTEATIRAVPPLKQRARGREPQLVEFIIDGRFFLDVEIGGGNVGFGLVIVVIRDEIFDRVVREEVLEFVIELRGQGFVVRHHQRGPVRLLDHLGHGVGLAGSGDAEQNLVLFAIEDTASQRFNGRCLIAARLVIWYEFEVHGTAVSFQPSAVSLKPGDSPTEGSFRG